MAPLADQIMYEYSTPLRRQVHSRPSKDCRSTSKQKNKGVSFATTLCKVHRIKPADDIWYSVQELRASKAEASCMAEILERQGLADNHEEWRGLETRTEEGNWLSYKTRQDVSNAVLDVQDQLTRHQRSANGDILLAKASREISVQSVQQAVERAQKDAEEAKRLYREMRVKQQNADGRKGRDQFEAPMSPSKKTLLSPRRQTTHIVIQRNVPQRA
uniref:Uncharacterized protein n=1 Tax=Amphora coffeiformis TaxID=265554 RepID=A0A7S3P8T5_9STRA